MNSRVSFLVVGLIACAGCGAKENSDPLKLVNSGTLRGLWITGVEFDGDAVCLIGHNDEIPSAFLVNADGVQEQNVDLRGGYGFKLHRNRKHMATFGFRIVEWWRASLNGKWTRRWSIEDHAGVQAVDFVQDSELLILTSSQCYRAGPESDLVTLCKSTEEHTFTDLAFDPKSRIAYVATSTGSVLKVSIAGKTKIEELKLAEWAINKISISPNSRVLAYDGNLYRTDNSKSTLVQTGFVFAMSFSHNSKYLAIASGTKSPSAGGFVDLVRVQNGEKICRIEQRSGCTSVAFSSDDRLLAIGMFDGSFRVCDLTKRVGVAGNRSPEP